MAPCDSQVRAADLHIRHLLRFHDRMTNVFFAERRVTDFAFADTPRPGLSQPDDVQRAIRAEIPDHGADL